MNFIDCVEAGEKKITKTKVGTLKQLRESKVDCSASAQKQDGPTRLDLQGNFESDSSAWAIN